MRYDSLSVKTSDINVLTLYDMINVIGVGWFKKSAKKILVMLLYIASKHLYME